MCKKSVYLDIDNWSNEEISTYFRGLLVVGLNLLMIQRPKKLRLQKAQKKCGPDHFSTIIVDLVSNVVMCNDEFLFVTHYYSSV